LLFIIGISTSNYKEGINYYNNKEYAKAYKCLNLVTVDDKNYKDAITKIKEIKPIIDSLNLIAKNHEIAKKNKEISEGKKELVEKNEKDNSITENDQKIQNIKKSIKSEVENNKPMFFTKYRGSIDAIKLELIYFQTMAKVINEGFKTKDAETIIYTNKLKAKMAITQDKEFPILRVEWVRLANIAFRNNNVKIVPINGNYKKIRFISPVFLTKDNIEDFYSNISDIIQMLRIKEVGFIPYSDIYSNETYYTVESLKDTEIESISLEEE